MNVRFSFDFKELSSALILIFSYLKGGEGMGLHAPPPPLDPPLCCDHFQHGPPRFLQATRCALCLCNWIVLEGIDWHPCFRNSIPLSRSHLLFCKSQKPLIKTLNEKTLHEGGPPREYFLKTKGILSEFNQLRLTR